MIIFKNARILGVTPLNKNHIKVTLYYNGEINGEIDQLSQKTF